MTPKSSVFILHWLTTVIIIVTSFQSIEASSQGRVFWVASSLDHCGSKTPCNTLGGYQSNSTVFSTSHSTWIFLKGEYFMAESDIVISGVTNITWTGEKDCVSGRAECILYIAVGWPGGYFVFLHSIIIKNAEFVSIKDIKVTHERVELLTRFKSIDRRTTKIHTCVLQVRNVQTFRIDSVSYIFSTDLFLRGKCIEIEQPSGSYDILNSIIQTTAFSFEAKTLGGWDISMDSCSEPRILILKIWNSHFLYVTFAINVIGGDSVDYDYVVIQITENQFIGVNIVHSIDIFGLKLPQQLQIEITIDLIIERNVFLGSSSTVVKLQLPVFLYQNKTQNTITIKQSNVSAVLNRIRFDQLKKFQLNFQFHCPYNCNITTCSERTVIYPTVRIQILSMAFFDECQAVLPRPPECYAQIMMLNYHPVIIAITTTSFQNIDHRYQAAVLSLHGFNWLRVSLEGNSTIILRSYAPGSRGLILEDSDLQIIESNFVYNLLQGVECRDQLCDERSKVSILLSSNSHLLLSNNSKLLIITSPENILSPRICITNHINETFEDFVNCKVLNPETCPGLCFFQFIDEYGRYFKEEELEYISAMLQPPNSELLVEDLYNITSPTYVVNGHFNKCRLNTLSGTTEVSNKIINKTFSYDVRKDATVPYEICLCQSTMPKNKTLWNCNQTSSVSVYHGQKVQLLVTLLGDFRKIIETYPEVVVTNINKEYSELSTRVRVCTSVYSRNIGKPNETHVLHLQTTHEVFREYTLHRYVNVHILPCPPGMIDVGTTCSCNTLLNYTDFVCNITNDVSYKTNAPNRWIGQNNVNDSHTVIIATYCPPYFCNSYLTEHGVTLYDLADDVQCENNRGGIMCSQCLDGKSAVFGSFKCHYCSYGWLALIPLFALAGSVIVVILFTFNLTVLQGTINGIVLYVNIIALMDDFLEKNAVRPLRVPLALINFDLGFTLCFFHGMDEFTKCFLLFAFPIFLFTILVAIVIAAVKCNLKIFRVPFIANRSVPVLGTIMLLTYTDLASAVITALRFTKIYNVTSGNYRTVWLYQPELEYFRGKHIGLAVIALLVSMVYLIPFTITMLLGDWLRRHIRKLWFSHFMDVLHGAFKWPMGFFFGLRLLVRILLITVSISVSSTEEFALSITTTVIILRVLQQILQPFKSTEQHEMYLPRHLVRKIPARFVKLIHLVKKLQPSLLDRLFLENILVLSIVMLLTSKTDHVIFPKIIVNVFLTIAIIQITAIMIYHGYKFFPVPKKAKKCFKKCGKCLAKSARNIVDYCKRNKDREEAGQPSPVIVYDIRDLVPPAVDESDSETESESGHDSECKTKIEMGTTTSASPLEEKLLSKSE